MKYVTKVCLSCSKEFNVQHKYRNSNKGYCSSRCANNRNSLEDVLCTCNECGKEFIRAGKIVARAKRNGIKYTFCSQRCTSAYFGRSRKTHKGTGFCKVCNTPVKGTRTIYCSNGCVWKDKNSTRIEAWLSGEWDGTDTHGLARILRRYIIEKNNHKCQKCLWGRVHPVTGFVPLTIHHIDGNWKNNRPENIELLCPNCHSLTDTYGSLNKGISPEGRSKQRRKAL